MSDTQELTSNIPFVLQFVTFESTKCRIPIDIEMVWDDVLKKFNSASFGPKNSVGLWSPTCYKNPIRGNHNVDKMTAFVYDIDHKPTDKVYAIFAHLKERNITFFAHATHSDTPEDRCFRLVIPYAIPLSIYDWQFIRKHLIDELGLEKLVDASTKDPARMYYLPCRPDGADYAFIEHTGQILDTRIQSPPTRKLDTIDAQSVTERLLNIKRDANGSKALARIIAEGQPLAQNGERDATMQRAAGLLAFAFPNLSDENLLNIIRPSLSKMPSDKPFDEELEKFKEKLKRARARQQEIKQQDAELLEDFQLKKAEIKERYQYSDLAQWAAQQKCSVDDFAKRWIIQCNNVYYIFVEGKYKGPYIFADFNTLYPSALARAPDVALYIINDKGKPRELSSNEVLRKYATTAKKVQAALYLQESYYDGNTETFWEAVSPLRKFAPTFHQNVDEWLRCLGDGHADKLLDWVACVTKLESACAALFLEGEANAGKSLLAKGLASLWSMTATPTSFSEVASDFNSSIAACPLVFADEGFPVQKGYNVNDELRRTIAATGHTLRRKFIPNAEIAGAIRLMMAANNDKMLVGFEDMNESDREALKQRLIYIAVSDGKAREYIETLTREEMQTWVDYKIAEHALWLRDNRPVVPGKRFIVQGESDEIQMRLSIGTPTASAICAFIAKSISRITPAQLPALTKLLRFGNGQIAVSMALFESREEWELYCPGTRRPPDCSLANTLNNLHTGTFLDGSTHFHIIAPKTIKAWCNRYNIIPWEAIEYKIGAAP